MMSDLGELQKALAKSLVAAGVRGAMIDKSSEGLSYPKRSASSHSLASSELSPGELSPAERELLSRFDARELERSRETLIRKRVSQTRQLLPLTTKAIGREYPRLFRRYVAEQPFSETQNVFSDAMAFSQWLAVQTKIASKAFPRAWSELAAWEILPYRIRRQPAWSIRLYWCKEPIYSHDTSLEGPGEMRLAKRALGRWRVWIGLRFLKAKKGRTYPLW